jgi:hypothetical protein
MLFRGEQCLGNRDPSVRFARFFREKGVDCRQGLVQAIELDDGAPGQ